jgi:hypothetical protein
MKRLVKRTMTKTEKKKYEKPLMRRVSLDGKCAVLGFCKSTTVVGPLKPNCNFGTRCSNVGS